MKAIRGVLVFILASSAACTTVPVVQQPLIEPTPVPASSDIAGEWMLTVESPMGRDDVRATFMQSGDQLTGTVINAGQAIPVTGTVHGNLVNFGISLDVRGQPLQLDYAGTIDGDSMSGTVQFGPIGSGKFSGRRGAALTE